MLFLNLRMKNAGKKAKKKCTVLENRLKINTLRLHGVRPHSIACTFQLYYKEKLRRQQCCRYVTFWYGSGSESGSADPYFWSSDLDPIPDTAPDPAIFFSDRQDGKNMFSCLLLFEPTFTSFFKDKKVIKKPQNSRNQSFSHYFCLMIQSRIRIRASYYWIRDCQKHTDPMDPDPDPQHWTWGACRWR